MSITREYIRFELDRNMADDAISAPVQAGLLFSPQSYLRQGISSQRAEELLTENTGVGKSWLIHTLFAHKEQLKRIPVLGPYLLRRKEDMLHERLSEMIDAPAIDLSDIIGWYRDDFIVACYQRLLRRTPDPDGWNTYVDMARRGADNRVIAYALMQSPEFGARAEVSDAREYRLAYKKFMRRQHLLHIPVLGRVVSLFLLSGQLDRIYMRLERSEDVTIQELRQVRARFSETQGLLSGMAEQLTQQTFALRGLPRQLTGQEEELRRLAKQIEAQADAYVALTKQLAGQMAVYTALSEQLTGQMAVHTVLSEKLDRQTAVHTALSEKLDRQTAVHTALSEKLDKQAVTLGQLSGKIDSQAFVLGKLSGNMDAMPVLLHSANIGSHTTVLGLPGGVTAVQCDDFILGLPSEEWGLAMFLSGGGTFEQGSERFFEEHLVSGSTVLDLGANLGIYTLRALRKGCTVFSFEPTPRICRILRENIKANGFEPTGRAHVVEAAVSSKNGSAVFFQNRGVCGQSSTLYADNEDDEKEKVTVETISLDSCRERFGRVDFIKIDIEGAEYAAFCGMRELLAENPDVKILMEFAPAHMTRAGVEPAAMLELISKLGFTAYKIDEETAQAEPVSEAELLEADSVNLYLVREK